MRKLTFSQYFFFPLLSILCLSTCTPTGNRQEITPPVWPKVENVPNEAPVERIRIKVLESFPVQVSITAYIKLPDQCKIVDDFTEERTDTVFTIKVLTVDKPTEGCQNKPRMAEYVIPLDVKNLKAGYYTVDVNGVTEMFVLPLDNTLPNP